MTPARKAPPLPAGVSWEDSPLFDFPKRPVLTLLPDLVRLLVVGHLVRHYGRTDEPDRTVTVLDVAAGFGELHEILRAERKARGTRLRYTGVDVDPRKRERALLRNPHMDYRLADLEVPGALMEVLEDQPPFDVIASTETLEHVGKEDGERFLLDLRLLLAPGGTIVLTSANPRVHRTNPWHLYEWPVEELRSFCEQQFRVMDWFYLKGASPALRERTGLSALRCPAELLRALPNPEGGSVTVAVLRRI